MSGGECRDGRVLHTIFFDGWREGGRVGSTVYTSGTSFLFYAVLLQSVECSAEVGGRGWRWATMAAGWSGLSIHFKLIKF